MRLLGLEVRPSRYVPSEGWTEKPDAARIRRENLDTLAHGGSLIDCEAPRSYGAVIFMFNGSLFGNPRNVAKLVGIGR